MADLVYKMIMALSAADIGDPICAQAAAICAEIADQHCAEIHQVAVVPVIATGIAS
jgi:hypothetical protein